MTDTPAPENLPGTPGYEPGVAWPYENAAAVATEPELNRAPLIITKAMRMAAAEALGFDPAIVKRIVIDAEARAIEVTTFVVKTDAAYVALNAPASGELLLTRRYPFDAEYRATPTEES